VNLRHGYGRLKPPLFCHHSIKGFTNEQSQYPRRVSLMWRLPVSLFLIVLMKISVRVLRRGPTFIDIFSGAGGSTLGFIHAGFVPLGALDKYGYALKTFTYNVHRLGFRPDIRRADAFTFNFDKWSKELGDVDVLVGCPPCQGFSRLRLNLNGGEDPRNQLISAYIKAVKAFRPRALVFENVPGILRSEYFSMLVNELQRQGYGIAYGVLNAADYGVPQLRRRLILVAVLSRKLDNFPPPPTHGPPSSPKVKEGLLKRWVTVRDAISDLPPLGPGENHQSIPNHVTKKLPEQWIRLIKAIPKDGGSRFDAPRELWLECHKRLKSGFNDVFGRLWWDRPSNVITTGCWDPSRGRFVHPEQDRGLSLRECARLQGFPDDFVFHGPKASVARQIGEALPPPLAKSVALYLRSHYL